MTRVNEQERAAVAMQASEWFVANRSGSLSRGESARFIDWLRASPIHVEEYLGVALISRDLTAAVANDGESVDTLIERARADATSNVTPLVAPAPIKKEPDDSSSRMRRWSLAALPIAAAVAAIAVGLGVVIQNRDGQRFGLPRTYQTAHGQQLAQTLPDGTTVHINTETAVKVRFTSSARVVELTHGQAYFQVARDSRRPFRVMVDGAELVDVGTSFDVYRRGSNTILTVIQGKVAVMQTAVPSAGSGPGAPSAPLVSAGQRIHLEHGAATAPPELVDVHQAEAWLNRQIIFRTRPLGEAVAELNRYAQTQIQIPDPAVRAKTISGVFNAYDTESFTAFIGTMNDLAVQQPSPYNIVIVKSARAEAPVAPPVKR